MLRGSGRKNSLDLYEVRAAVQAEPLKSIRAHAKAMGTMFRALQNLGARSLVRVERPLLMTAIKEVHLLRCKGILNKMRKFPSETVIHHLQ